MTKGHNQHVVPRWWVGRETRGRTASLERDSHGHGPNPPKG
jgi:hypothetical protein